MLELLNSVKSLPSDERIKSKRAREYVKLMRLYEELEREKTRLDRELQEDEKQEAFEALSREFNIPPYVTVRDAAEIMGISPQMIRRYCAEGKLSAQQTLEGSGKWRIATAQLMEQPNWERFIDKRAKLKKQSAALADEVLTQLDSGV
ncbi:helix-turn-helix domain-containing protein [Indiicoccus explosivorum]|uniref:helix-turn-helix domain-containing protein n=1 Tax=Indiicoccus explosivorum TaxID=1917864 RepID=UPI0013904A9C|nr:helix-turn-helix domain-containing protein [Indiicoccus explosivorum]